MVSFNLFRCWPARPQRFGPVWSNLCASSYSSQRLGFGETRWRLSSRLVTGRDDRFHSRCRLMSLDRGRGRIELTRFGHRELKTVILENFNHSQRSSLISLPEFDKRIDRWLVRQVL